MNFIKITLSLLCGIFFLESTNVRAALDDTAERVVRMRHKVIEINQTNSRHITRKVKTNIERILGECSGAEVEVDPEALKRSAPVLRALKKPQIREREKRLTPKRLRQQVTKYANGGNPQEAIRAILSHEEVFGDIRSELKAHLKLLLYSEVEDDLDADRIINAKEQLADALKRLLILNRREAEGYARILFRRERAVQRQSVAVREALVARQADDASWWPKNSTWGAGWGAAAATTFIVSLYLILKP